MPLEIQRKIAAANDELPEARRMLFRIGINVGDVMVKNGDIFGDGVNVADGSRPWPTRVASA